MERHPLPKLIWADFPGGAVVKNSPANGGDARDEDSNPGSERSPGEGNGNTLQYTCLENPIYRGAWSGYSPWGPNSSKSLKAFQH